MNLERVETSFRKFPPIVVTSIGLVLVSILWSIDRLIPNQVSLSIFYLIPAGFVAWFAGKRWAYIVSVAAAAAWLINDLAIPRAYPYRIVPYWNAFVRLGFFVTVSYMAALIAHLRRLHDAEAATSKAAIESSELKSRMISFVSHEFYNSLTTFKAALGMLKACDPIALAEERKQGYEILDRVFVHLYSATSNFLNLNRLESGRFIPELRRVLLPPLVQGVISVLGPLVKIKNVDLQLRFPAEPLPVNADPDALALVLSNLIGNALKYTPDGGTVAVDVSPDRGGVIVSVKDSGIGIPKDIQQHIFSDYYRAEGGKILAKGYGIGLNVARELLDVQGVELKLQSGPNQGSRFYFRLPVYKDQDERSFFYGD